MLYESDVSSLISKWETNLSNHSADYGIGVRDCIYDLRTLMDNQLADEAFEEQLKVDANVWENYFKELLADGILA